MIERPEHEYPDFVVWLGLACAALVTFLATMGTTFHQLAIGLLSASVALLVASTLFECLWRILMAALYRESDDIAGTPHSQHRGRGATRR